MYQLFSKDSFIKEINDRNEYINLDGVTKFIVLLGFLDCIKKYNIKVTDYIYLVLNYKEKDITFIDIINHTSGLEYQWDLIINKKKYQSNLQKKFYNSTNINNFCLNLKRKKEYIDNYNYNNISYNILSYTIYVLTGKNIEEYLKESILKNILYKWNKINGIHIAGFGLYIHSKDMKTFLLNLTNYIYIDDYYYDKITLCNNFENNIFIGHSDKNSYLYYCKKINCLYAIFNYKNNLIINYKNLLLKNIKNII